MSTPQETQAWLQGQLVTILQTNNPAAAPAEVSKLATELSGLWAMLVLPNLLVDLVTGAVTFVVPPGSP